MYVFFVLYFVLNRVLDSASTQHRNKHSLGDTINQSGVPIPGWAGRAGHEYPISVLAALRERGDMDPVSKRVDIDTKHLCIA